MIPMKKVEVNDEGKVIPFSKLTPEQEVEREKEFVEQTNTNAPLDVLRSWEGPKRLLPKHILVLKCYGVLAMTLKEIADHPDTYLKNPSDVWRLINSVAGQNYLKEVIEPMVNDEMMRMRSIYNNVIRMGMTSPDPRERIAAAGLYQKHMKDSFTDAALSAEDEIKDMMSG